MERNLMIPSHPQLETAIKAVREAASLTTAVQKELDPNSLEKKDRSPVTIADFGSQALTLRRIGDACPDDPVIAEEGSAALKEPENQALASKMMGYIQRIVPEASFEQACSWIDRGESRDYAERFWTLDPIDGTKGFLRGEQYAISLALIEQGQIQLGLLSCPNISSYLPEAGGVEGVFFAIRNGGAWILPEGSSDPVRLHASDLKISDKARFVESYESGHSDHSWSQGVAAELGITEQPVRLDSQAKYAILGAGAADLYLRLPTRPGYVEKIWDHAAGVILVEEAGGKVTDIEGNPLEWNHGYRLEKNRGVVASGGGFHQRIIEAISTHQAG
jgi:3'(2'), 5'-bisphosphate nucleotidase